MRKGLAALIAITLLPLPATAATLLFDSGGATNLMAMASRPDTSGAFEIETADDFILAAPASISSLTFTGLLVGSSPSVSSVDVEIYRVFPLDSNTTRTPRVPTRNNSPSDVAFASRSSSGDFTFSTSILNPTFTVLNSIQPGDIHPSPNQTTGGHGSVTGTEVLFTVNLSSPLTLPADHYFFVPQVGVTGGTFYWLSAPRPNSATVFSPDLQAWTRDAFLDPDWLRIGTDIVGGTTPPTFNAAFTLSGTVVPLPAGLGPASTILLGAGLYHLKRRRGSAPD
jgi:hypothetical protein